MFQDLMNTGEDYWSASSGIAPSCETSSGINPDEEVGDDDDDSDLDDVTPMSGRGTKRGMVNDNGKGKKAKTTQG